MNKFNVLHLVSGDFSSGAARGAYTLHKSLLSIGVDSNFVLSGFSSRSDVLSISKTPRLKALRFFQQLLDSLPVRLYRNRKKVIFSPGLVGFDITTLDAYKDADVIHLHWINSGFISLRKIKQIKKPIIWTIRDMWPMTGGCHIAKAFNCNNYLKSCGNCPQLSSNSRFDLSRLIFEFKRSMIPASIELVGLSNWICDEVKKSPLLKNNRVTYIPNAIDSISFSPVNKKEARKILGVKTEKKIILVGAYSLDDFNKGFDLFLQSINHLNPKDYYISIFGELDEKLIAGKGFEYKIFGRQYDEISLKLIYSHANVFVAPSLMESFGKTLAESMACGTPVVCFGATGQLDIVDHQTNGYLANPYNPKDLAKGIEWLSSSDRYKKIRQSAIRKIRKNFNQTEIAKLYSNLYTRLLIDGK